MKDPNTMPSNNLVTTGHDSKETDINCSPWWYIDDTDDKGKLRDGNTFYIRGFEALGKQIEVYTKTCTKEDFVSKQVKDGCYVVPQGVSIPFSFDSLTALLIDMVASYAVF